MPSPAKPEKAMAIVYNAGFSAGIAQLVERNLAKVEVASSSLVSRSRFRKTTNIFQPKGKLSFPFLRIKAR